MIVNSHSVKQEFGGHDELMRLKGEIDVLRELAGLLKKGSKVV